MTHREYHPPHLYRDQTIYFITCRTVDKENFFATDAKKDILYSCLKTGLRRFKIAIYAFVILNNHYHLLIKAPKADILPMFVKHLNGKSSFELNKLECRRGRKIWYQYWDHCIRDEADFWKHFNYIHHNPVKHGLCQSEDEVFYYQFSSVKQWVKMKGKEWLDSCFELYPIIDFTAAE